MKFRSVRGKSPPVGFREALLQGQAPDGGLYVPEGLPALPPHVFSNPGAGSLHEIAFQTLSLFLSDEFTPEELRGILQSSLTFPIPLVQLEERLYLLELFHGPTLAFKDIGARCMAQMLSLFLERDRRDITILVATSGDTGGAVAHGFFGLPHIRVCVLYPSKKISRLQELQITTLGGNIRAVEVDGTFDDCQRLVKMSLADTEASGALCLSTANSINLGRLLPQITYYVWCAAQWQQQHSPGAAGIVVPVGNFGNLTAALYAARMGTPFTSFVAAANANDMLKEYFRTGTVEPRPSLQTLSSAMDVGNPSNLERIRALYGPDLPRMRREIGSFCVSDEETLLEIRRTYEQSASILDPHTAVGVAAARRALRESEDGPPLIVAATAHPAKFQETVLRAIGITPPLPPVLRETLEKQKQTVKISASYEEWKKLLFRLAKD